jgi:hypothetical protein
MLRKERTANMYRSIDAVRLFLMAQKAMASLSKEPCTASMIAEKAMHDTYDVPPPYAWDGVSPHLLKFAKILMRASWHESFTTEPLPGEDALSHSMRLRLEKAALDVHIKEMDQYISKKFPA